MRIVISSINEETDCNFCGEPLYLGDLAHFGEDFEYYCSPSCATHHAHRSELKQIGRQFVAGEISREEMQESACSVQYLYEACPF